MNISKAIINTKNIKHNLRIIREKTDNKIIGIVKANGYGFGMNSISKVLREEGVEMLGVPYAHEAEGLRHQGDTGEILLTGTLKSQEVEDVIRLDLQVSTVNVQVLEELNKVAIANDKIVKIQIFVDTGMNREGVKTSDLEGFLEKVKNLRNLKVVGCLTHLIASEDMDKSQTLKQIDDFEIAVKQIEEKFGKLEIIHTHNSAAIFNNIRNIGTYTRPGFAIYGFLPTRELFEKSDLLPGIQIVSEVSLIKNVRKGETIGYSNKFIADKDIQIALIPFGYGHGFPSALSNIGVFSINHQACRIVGSVCMDFITVDVTDKDVNIGNEVIIMGNDGVSDTIYDIAEKAKTLPYEIITHLLPRLDREYR